MKFQEKEAKINNLLILKLLINKGMLNSKTFQSLIHTNLRFKKVKISHLSKKKLIATFNGKQDSNVKIISSRSQDFQYKVKYFHITTQWQMWMFSYIKEMLRLLINLKEQSRMFKLINKESINLLMSNQVVTKWLLYMERINLNSKLNQNSSKLPLIQNLSHYNHFKWWVSLFQVKS